MYKFYKLKEKYYLEVNDNLFEVKDLIEASLKRIESLDTLSNIEEVNNLSIHIDMMKGFLEAENKSLFCEGREGLTYGDVIID